MQAKLRREWGVTSEDVNLVPKLQLGNAWDAGGETPAVCLFIGICQ